MRRATLLVPLLLAGCAQPAEDNGVVEALTASFDPSTLTVAPGETVTWRVASGNHHTVTVADPRGVPGAALGDSGDLGPGAEYSFAFTDIGMYDVYCRYHSQGGQGHFNPQEMTMLVTVAADAA